MPDEDEQVRYLDELLDVFEGATVDTALWLAFANYDKPGDRDIAVLRRGPHARRDQLGAEEGLPRDGGPVSAALMARR